MSMTRPRSANPPTTRRRGVPLGPPSKRRRLLWKVKKRRQRAKLAAKNIDALTIRTYEDLMHALRVRRLELGLTQMDVDEIAGFHTGYTGKLEVGYKEGGRGLGGMSLPTLLDALGVRLKVVPR